MNSTVKKRSIVIGRHKTSISLEDSFWSSLREIAQDRATTVSELIRGLIRRARGATSPPLSACSFSTTTGPPWCGLDPGTRKRGWRAEPCSSHLSCCRHLVAGQP
jgi:hypothetical protein